MMADVQNAQQYDANWTRAEFPGKAGRLARVIVAGTTLQLLTFGIYRFWYLTNLRRYFWGNTHLDGDALEYTGRGRELFMGFLVAMVVIVPTIVGLTILTIALGPTGWLLSFAVTMLFILLRHYARYRARRYQLTRTVWRGLRFHMSGSAWTYAFKACGLYGLVILTLGLAYPFALARLEQYKVSNTWYGNLKGEFDGVGRDLFGATLAFWVACVAATIFSTPVLAIASADDLPSLLPFLALSLFSGVFVFLLLWPLYRAILFRWWANGVRFGALYIRSDLSNGAFYRAYFLYGLACIPLLLVFGVLTAVTETLAKQGQSAAAVALALGYLIMMSVLAGLYQLIVARLVWSRQVSSVSVCGLEQLDTVQARGDESSAFGEGVLDALDAVGS